MDSMGLYEQIKEVAAREFKAGRKSKKIFAEADEMDATGFSVSAPFHQGRNRKIH
jgi:hypothetical protein